MRRITAFLLSLLVLIFGVNLVAAQDAANWEGAYFDNAYLGGEPVFTQSVNDLSFYWGYGSPGSGVPSDNFSARWNTDVELDGGDYRFYAYADDNVNVTIDYGNSLFSTFETSKVGQLVSGDVTLSPGSHNIQVNYRELTEEAYVYFSFESLEDGVDGPDFAMPTDVNVTGNLWSAAFFDNPDLAGTPVATRTQETLSRNWGTGAPLPSVPTDNWSAVFTSQQTLDGGEYEIRANADDGLRVYVDGEIVIDQWHIATARDYVAELNLAPGEHTFEVEYFENEEFAQLEYDFVRINEQVDPDTRANATLATPLRAPLVVRESPNSVNAGIVSTINQGETFYVLGEVDANWDVVQYNGITGYVNAAYVQPVDTPPDQPAAPATNAELIAPNYNVNIRAEAGIEFEDVGTLPPDRPVTVIGRNANNTWWKINYNGIRGWVTAEYTRLTPSTDIGDIPVVGS